MAELIFVALGAILAIRSVSRRRDRIEGDAQFEREYRGANDLRRMQ